MPPATARKVRPAAAGAKGAFLRRRHGQEAADVPHPALAPVLRESHGLPLFEDDVIAVVETLTGLPAAEADLLRRRLTGSASDPEAQAAFLSACERGEPLERTVQVPLAGLLTYADTVRRLLKKGRDPNLDVSENCPSGGPPVDDLVRAGSAARRRNSGLRPPRSPGRRRRRRPPCVPPPAGAPGASGRPSRS